MDEALALAPYDERGWIAALGCVAALSRSRLGQFINWSEGVGAFSLANSLDVHDHFERWIDAGGDDPSANPIISVGRAARPLAPFADSDLIGRDGRAKNRVWQEFYLPVDMPHIATTILHRESGSNVVLSAVRSASQGHFTRDDLDLLAAIGVRWRRAVLHAKALGDDGVRLVGNALDAAAVAAVLLDRFDRVRLATRAAETLFSGGGRASSGARYAAQA